MLKAFFVFLILSILYPMVNFASDPLLIKRQQMAQLKMQQAMKQAKVVQNAQQNQKIKQTREASQKTQLNKAMLVAKKVQPSVPTAPFQKAKVDLSAFAILPMENWKNELKVPTTSNDGIEIIPHPVSQ